jgi:integrase
MYRRIFKQSGSRVYRLRYRIGDDLRLHDVPLHTSNLEVAEAKADEIILEAEKASLGIGIPRPLRDAQKRPALEHIAEHLAHMEQRGRSKSHVRHARVRLQRLFSDCRWRYLSDVTADRFLAWRAENEELSQKTRNEYLAHANTFFNWLLKQDRILNNPLRGVFKMETRGMETFQRRALSFPEVGRLVTVSTRRGFLYLVAIGTGLRRNELKQLRWPDLILEGSRPVVRLRAETTKAKRADEVPIVPVLVELLQAAKKRARDPSGLVFPRGISRPKTLAKDLEACGIKVEDEHGCRVDFHALRHTYTTLMGDAGVSELARVKLARHRTWKLTDRYTDTQRLPLHAEMGKFGAALASSIASQNSGKTWPNQGNVVQVASELVQSPIRATADSETVLVGAEENSANEEWRRGGDSNPR